MKYPVWQANLDFTETNHSPVESSLDNCIKCNICVTVCPVAAVTDAFPGPKYEAPQAARFRGGDEDPLDASVDYCSGCRACNIACPTGVKIAEINARSRGKMARQGAFSPIARLRNNLIARPETLGKIGKPLAPLANWALANPITRQATEKGLGIARQAPLPAFSRESFIAWFNNRPKPTGLQRKIIYFRGCATEYYELNAGKATVRLLEKVGFEVMMPPQNCCGLPLLSNGEFAAAQRMHDANTTSLADWVRQGHVIVGSSTSCTLTLKEEAPELLDDFSPDSRLVAGNTFDIHEFLWRLYASGELQTEKMRPIPLRLPYHPPCQYKAHRIGLPSLELMKLIPKLEIMVSDAICCGIAGTYGYKSEKYDISMAVGKPLFDFVRRADAPLAVCDSETCRWQITHGSGVATIHPIELLSAAFGLPAEEPLRSLLEAADG